MPRTARRTHRNLRFAAALIGAAVVAVACAPSNSPPNVPVQGGKGLVTQIVDAINDAGRMPAVTLDKDGNPAVSYLLLKKVLKKGELPVPLVPNTPQPPAVILATFSSDQGYWSRGSVTAQDFKKGVGLAQGLSYADGTPIPGVNTSVAADAQGAFHVVWSTGLGVFYSTNAPGPAFSDPVAITRTPALGASIAVAGDGTPWVAYYEGNDVDVASLSGKKWLVQTVAASTNCALCPPVRTAIAVTPSGQPVVAYTDAGAGSPRVAVVPPPLTLTPGAGGPIRPPAEVGAGTGGFGISLAIGKDGGAHVAYYGKDGTVYEASSAAGDPLQGWTTKPITQAPLIGATTGWSTGVAADDSGKIYVTWADTVANGIVLATSADGSAFAAQAVPQSVNGVNPALAVTGDGSNLVLPFYDRVAQQLNVTTLASGGLVIAAPSPTPSPPPQPNVPACAPTDSTDLAIVAQNIAFDLTCLAVVPNTDFAVAFDNKDVGTPHNFAIYQDAAYTKLLGGATSATDFVTGPDTTTYQVSGLAAGSYYFRCDLHPTQMTGQFIVAAPSKGAGTTTPAPSPTSS